MNSGVKLDEFHQYTAGGRKVPGVSQILEATGFIQLNAFWTDAGREKGTRLHAACHEINTGTFDFDDTDLDVYLEAVSYAEWKATKGFKVLLAETMLYSETYGYAGTFDAFGIFPNGDYVMIDFKRGSALACVRFQLALYVILLCENSEHLLGKKIYPFQVKRFVLDRIGREKPHMEYSPDKRDYDIALAAVACFNMQVGLGIQRL